jgi:LacI family transcriptional regulator
VKYFVGGKESSASLDQIRLENLGENLSCPFERYGVFLMSATVSDVAEKAGVSVATVSRVFNESGRVREATRERVIEAAQALDYVPNQAARSLKTRETQTIGVVLPDMHGEFFAEVVRGLDAVAHEHGYHLLVSSSHGDAGEVQSVLDTLRGRADALIVLWPHSDASFLDDITGSGPPLLLLSAPDGPADVPRLAVDNLGGAYAATMHLAEHGHDRVAVFTGPEANAEARDRLAGYRQAIRDAGAVSDPDLVFTGDFSRESGAALAHDLLACEPCPSALFAANDAMAIGALRTLTGQGVDVPDDLAIVGFDDIPTARYVSPALTTVRVPMRTLGRQGMQRVLNTLSPASGDASSQTQTLDTELIVRTSCGC